MALTQGERLIKAKILLQDERPFFAYLIMRLKIRESTENELASVPTICVTPVGTVIFNAKFIETLNDDEVKAVLAHEMLHVAFLHIPRKPKGVPIVGAWNIAIDIVTNAILVKEGFKIPAVGIQVAADMTCNVMGKQLRDVDKLCSEEIFHWLRKNFGDNLPSQGGWDEHIDGPSSGAPPLTDEQIDELGREWRGNMSDALQAAKRRGVVSGYLEGLVDDTLNPRVDWRTTLLRFITSQLPIGWTWSRPHKKSFSLGVYLPYVVREFLEVVIHVDSSGSISDAQLTEFFSEVKGILESFSSIKITLIICDAKIQGQPYELDINNWNPFVQEKKQLGRGGTSHAPVVKWINKHKPDARVFVTFTDGYSDMHQTLPDLVESCHRLILLSDDSDRRVEEFKDLGEVIRVNL